jgi:archaetidylserine synthase
MVSRFVGRLGLADGVTICNGVLGLVAVLVAPTDPSLAARIVLLAAVADGLDGIIARFRGHTRVGPVLDSIADVVSFGVAPAALVVAVLSPAGVALTLDSLAAAGVGAGFLALAIVRLGFYTIDDVERSATDGVQTTLAATLLAAGYLAGLSAAPVFSLGTALLAVAMVAGVTYPDLRARDAFVMGTVQVLAIAVPTAFGRVFPRALFAAACGYLLFAPWLYRWTSTPARSGATTGTTQVPMTPDGGERSPEPTEDSRT